MSLMTEALPIEEYEALEKGIRIKKKRVVKKEPSPPDDLKNVILFSDINPKDVKDIVSARLKTIKNREGSVFIYVDVDIVMKPNRVPLKDGGVEVQERRISGIMPEVDWYKLYREVREKITIENIEF